MASVNSDTTDAKSKNSERKQIANIISQHLIDKQLQNRQRTQFKARTCHRSIYIAKIQYKCGHCDKKIDDVVTCNTNNCHRCYATPSDKETNNLSLQWLTVNKTLSDCPFKHDGPCLSIINDDTLPIQTSSDVNLYDVTIIKQRVKDIVFGYIKIIHTFIPSIISYWCLLYYAAKIKVNYKGWNAVNTEEKLDLHLKLFANKMKINEWRTPISSGLSTEFGATTDRFTSNLDIYSTRLKRKKRRHRNKRKQQRYIETFELDETQMELLKTAGFLELLQTEIKEFGTLSFQEHSKLLELSLPANGCRIEVIRIIENHLGAVTKQSKIDFVASRVSLYDVHDINQSFKDIVFGYIKNIQDNIPPIISYWCLLYFYEKQQELIFPLTDKQDELLQNPDDLQILMNDMNNFGGIRVNDGFLTLWIPINIPSIIPIHKLEKRLSILLTVDEIQKIRENIDDIEILTMNDKQFVKNMMIYIENGVKFIRHKKRGVSDQRFITVYNDRLYWMEKQYDPKRRSRSMNFAKIIQIEIGKRTKALRHESFNHIPANCCFSIYAKKATLDLSSPTLDPIQVTTFTAYLKGLQTHFMSLPI